MTAQIKSFPSSDRLFDYAARDFFREQERALTRKSSFDVALSGGSTAKLFFKKLATMLRTQSLEHSRFFFSDERAVDLASAESNAGIAFRALLKPGGVAPKNFFPPFKKNINVNDSADKYQKLLHDKLEHDQDGTPVFDLIYLGIGSDGHTASLFPRSDLVNNIDANPHLIGAVSEEFLAQDRITMMPKLILAARKIVFMATGPDKQAIIDQVITGDLRPHDLPAQLIARAQHPNMHVYRSNSSPSLGKSTRQ